MGHKILISITNTNNSSDALQFEFDERKFSGLMKKYRSQAEIRKMILQLFTKTKGV